MERSQIHERIHYTLASCIAVSMPFSIKINSILIILLALNSIASGKFISQLRTSLGNRINILFISFFLIHVIGALTSANHHEGWAIVERRLSLLAFPLILFRPVSEKQLKTVCSFFVSGITVAMLYCFLIAFIDFESNGLSPVFFYHSLTSPIHMNAVYMSAYVLFSIHIVLNNMNWKEGLLNIFFLLLLAFLICSLFMLTSKMMLILLPIGLFIWLLKFSPFLVTRKMVFLTSGFLLILFILLVSIPKIKERFAIEFASDFSVLEQSSYKYDTHFTGTSLRLKIWKESFALLNEHKAWLMGVGTGDFQDLLNQRYLSLGIYTGNPELKDTGYLGYGPHNEYIEVLLSLGVVTLALFILLLVLLIKVALNTKNYLLIQLLLVLCCFSLSESVLSTNKGIIFFVFFTNLLHAKAVLRDERL